LQDEELSAVLHQLGATTAGEQPNRRSERAPPVVTTSSLRSAFGRMVQSLCEDRLHVFAWDDAHSIDRTTLEALVSTAGRSPGLRAVFVLTVRAPEDESAEAPFMKKAALQEAFAAHPHTHHIELRQFSDDDSAKFIASRVNAKVVPPELLGFCRDRAGGHPLFLEEMLMELSDSVPVRTMSRGLTL